jgi:branched-chain amino acid transport system ATP-binding protein
LLILRGSSEPSKILGEKLLSAVPPLLQVDRVTKSFKGISAITDLTFSVREGEVLGLIGPNGAGKTTAFNLISGTYKPDSGQIIFDKKSIVGKKSHNIAKLGVARTFQTVRPLSRMSVIENVMMGSLFGRNNTLFVAAARERAMEILGYIALAEKANLPAGTLSLAEQRRLELARALATQPKLLLLDEVMAGLNPSEISNALDLLKRLNTEKQITLVVIEHVIKAVMKLCNRIVVLDHGQKIAEGLPEEIARNSQVIEAYMGEKKAGRKRMREGDSTSMQDAAPGTSETKL